MLQAGRGGATHHGRTLRSDSRWLPVLVQVGPSGRGCGRSVGCSSHGSSRHSSRFGRRFDWPNGTASRRPGGVPAASRRRPDEGWRLPAGLGSAAHGGPAAPRLARKLAARIAGGEKGPPGKAKAASRLKLYTYTCNSASKAAAAGNPAAAGPAWPAMWPAAALRLAVSIGGTAGRVAGQAMAMAMVQMGAGVETRFVLMERLPS